MTECLERDWGNPSSVHRAGIAARRRVDLARETVADLVGCRANEIVFTSGGTEAGNLAIVGGVEHVLEACPARRIVACPPTEHPAVRDAVADCTRRGARSRELAVDADGVVDLEALATFLAEEGDRCALVSVMWANNETGVVQPIERIGALCREHGVLFHTDAVQWVGRMPCDFDSLPIDLLSCSAHKFHGPKGVGALVIRQGVRVSPRALGGSQERERRGGTENVAAIAGMAAACELARTWLDGGHLDRMTALRERFETLLLDRIEGALIHGRGVRRLWNTTSLALPGRSSQMLVMVLSERGLAASGGAACASGSVQPSGVLLAMGVDPELAASSLRLSFGRDTGTGELEQAACLLAEVAETSA